MVHPVVESLNSNSSLTSPSDCNSNSELIARIAAGDNFAFKEFFEHYQHKLFQYIFRIIKSRQESEELVLDIFLKVWNVKEVLPEVQNIDAFLYRMAVNKALDFLRTATREKKLRNIIAGQISLLQLGCETNPYLAQEYEEQLKMFIQKLPSQQQIVLNMSRESGLTHQQIADQLHLSKNTVKNHISTALKHLRIFIKNINVFF